MWPCIYVKCLRVVIYVFKTIYIKYVIRLFHRIVWHVEVFFLIIFVDGNIDFVEIHRYVELLINRTCSYNFFFFFFFYCFQLYGMKEEWIICCIIATLYPIIPLTDKRFPLNLQMKWLNLSKECLCVTINFRINTNNIIGAARRD